MAEIEAVRNVTNENGDVIFGWRGRYYDLDNTFYAEKTFGEDPVKHMFDTGETLKLNNVIKDLDGNILSQNATVTLYDPEFCNLIASYRKATGEQNDA